jgi:hypothetical protein
LSFSYWIDYLGFITEGKLAAIFIKPSLGVSNWTVILLHQQTQSSFLSSSSSPRHQQVFWRRCRGKRRHLQGECRTHILYFVLSFALLYFYLHHFIKKQKKISFLYSCFYLSAFSFARMATHENTKLCDFTSTNNSDYICTPIAPPAPAADFYAIKPALLNLVMKEQFFGARRKLAPA